MHVLGDVAGLVNSGDSGADAEVHVGQETMLRVLAAHPDGARISIPDFKIDVAHRGIERARAGVLHPAAASPAGAARSARWGTALRAPAARRLTGRRPAPSSDPPAREEHHVLFAVLVLVARRVLSQHEHRPVGAIPDHPNSGPDSEGRSDPVAPFGNKDDCLGLVDRLLNCLRVVGHAIAVHGEVVPRQVDCFRIVQPDRVIRRRPRRNGRQNNPQEQGTAPQHRFLS